MTGPVDVLAVLDQLIEYHDTSDSLKGRNCIAARAAVAELIEAATRVIRAFEAYGKAQGLVTEHRCRQECEAAMLAQKAALANLGSAS